MKRAQRFIRRTVSDLLHGKVDGKSAVAALDTLADTKWMGQPRRKLQKAALTIRKGIGDVDKETVERIMKKARTHGNQRIFRGVF